ncbi:hypothetical protein V2J09_003849 [Rumex salicifolius]
MATMPTARGRTKSIVKRSKKYVEEALYYKLFKNGSDEVSVRHQLNEFLKSRKRVYKWEVGDTIKKLRDRKRYFPALKLSDAMARRGMNMTVSDQAIHLDLIAKTNGIAAAENYFVDLPETSKNIHCYGALFNCYCKELSTEKAEALMEKMKELGLPLTSMSYNSLMTLYTKVGNPEKVTGVIQEMKASDVMFDSYTYNVWMRALAASDDISGVERVIDEMKRDGRVASDWTTYSNLASIYVNAGFLEKAELALKELEKRNTSHGLSAYQYLITLYGRTGNLQETYRVWRSFRLAFPQTPNIGYLNMIQALLKMKDLPGAEKCFKDWETGCSTYDIRVANALISAYVNDGLLEKAEKLKEGARRKGGKPNAKTWEIFLDHYLKNEDIKAAVNCIENAITLGRGDGSKWIPSTDSINTVMRHLEQEKDVDGAESFIEMLKKAVNDVGSDVFESLIRTHANAGRSCPSLRRRLKMENVEVSEECNKLLDEVCKD